MDSGSVAAMAGWLRQRHGMDSLAPLHAYCWDFDHLPDYDERDVSRILTDHYQLPVVDVPADKNWPLATYPAHSPDRDDPFIWPLQALHNQVMATAKADGMSAVFSGERGDEMVGSGVLDLHSLLRPGAGVNWDTNCNVRSETQREFDLSMREVIKRLLITPYLWSRLSQRRFERLRQSFGRERRDTRYPDWIRPEFAQRIGLGNIKADCMTSPGIKGVVGWDNRSSSFWPRSSDHFDHFGKHQSGIYMPQGPEFIRCDYPNPLPSKERPAVSVTIVSSVSQGCGRHRCASAVAPTMGWVMRIPGVIAASLVLCSPSRRLSCRVCKSPSSWPSAPCKV